MLSLVIATLAYSGFGILARYGGFEIPIFFASYIRGIVGFIFFGFVPILFRLGSPLKRKDAFLDDR